jgi:CubicO group peptidase (beta-lactamase class C family)
MAIEAALEYARKHDLHSVVITRAGDIIAEEYGAKADAGAPHMLYSGTKSFWGIAALVAQADGIFNLDERVAKTLAEWKGDAEKALITPRMLLQLTAGYGFGGLGSAVPTYDRALAMPLKNGPGETFTYSGIPLQVFGAFFMRKLAPHKQTPHEYLTERVLRPAKVHVASWRTLKDGTHPLPTGAALTAREWIAYGQNVLEHRKTFAEAFKGSKQNTRYGLGWWLGAAGAPEDLFYASGSGGQGMYIAPSAKTIAVHFGGSASYKHDAFLKRLFSD